MLQAMKSEMHYTDISTMIKSMCANVAICDEKIDLPFILCSKIYFCKKLMFANCCVGSSVIVI